MLEFTPNDAAITPMDALIKAFELFASQEPTGFVLVWETPAGNVMFASSHMTLPHAIGLLRCVDLKLVSTLMEHKPGEGTV